MDSQFDKILVTARRVRPFLYPVFGVGLLAVFAFWLWRFWESVVNLMGDIGSIKLIGLAVLLLASVALSVCVLVVLIQSKGYKFSFLHAYQALNISQLASMIPGGVWGFAGFAGALWSKGVSKPDSAIIVFLNTVTMLTACAIVGISGLATVLGNGYVLLAIAPFIVLLLARNRLELFRQQYYPVASQLPSIRALLFSLSLGVVVWTIVGICFAAFLYQGPGASKVPILVVLGAYATGYLGGYLSLFAPSGIGVSEGLTALLLSPYVRPEHTLAAAVAFRVFHTLLVWLNVLATLALHSRKNSWPTS